MHFFLRISSILLLLQCWLSLSAQHVMVESSLDSTSILVGEQVNLHVIVSCKANSQVKFPTHTSGYVIHGLEILATLPIDTIIKEDGKMWQLQRTYVLTSFDSAVYKIPQQEVVINGQSYKSAHEIALKVNTIEVDFKHPDDIRPAKAPIEGVFSWTFHLLGCCGILWLLTIGWMGVLRQTLVRQPKFKIVKVKTPPPPHNKAMEAIEQLRHQDIQNAETQKTYFVELTDILRTYLYERFGFNAKEMTSHEIVTELSGVNDAMALRELRGILQTADLIKFARHNVSLAESDRALLQAVDYVRTTQSQEALPEYEEKVVDIAVRTLNRRKRLLVTLQIVILTFALGLFAYICYLIWAILP